MDRLWLAPSTKLTLLEQQHLWDMGQDAALTYGHTSQQLSQRERNKFHTKFVTKSFTKSVKIPRKLKSVVKIVCSGLHIYPVEFVVIGNGQEYVSRCDNLLLVVPSGVPG